MDDADLRSLLDRGAAGVEPSAGLPERALRAGRRRLRRRRAAAVAGSLALVVLAAFALPAALPDGDGVDLAGREDASAASFAPAGDGWGPAFAAPIAGRLGHTATWTGHEVVVWGGWAPNEVGAFADGARLSPARNGWLPMAPAPIAARKDHLAVWTGREVLVWGGVGEDEEPLADGAAYDPAADRWRVLPAAPLLPRRLAAGAWTGEELVVWGGIAQDGAELDARADGAAYSPASDTWRPLPDAPLDGRGRHHAVWTGSSLLVMGGASEYASGLVADAAAYDPSADRWARIAEVPDGGRVAASAEWTGDELLLWGGERGVDGGRGPTATGVAYDPASDTWRRMAQGPLSPRASAVSAWVDGRLAVVGGTTQRLGLRDAAAYDPVRDTWARLPDVPLDGRVGSTATALEGDLLVWGGADAQVFEHFADGALLHLPDPGDGPRADPRADPMTARAGAPVAAAIEDGEVELVGEGGRRVRIAFDGADERPIAVAVRPGSTEERVEAVVLAEDGDGYGFVLVSGPLSDLETRSPSAEVAPPPQAGAPPTPVFSPDGLDLGWVVSDGGVTASLLLAPWDDGEPRAPRVHAIELPEPADVRLTSWFGSQRADGGLRSTAQLTAEGGPAYGLDVRRTSAGDLGVGEPRARRLEG